MKQTAGETLHNENLANEGAAQQVKGQAQQAWGSVKEAAQDVRDRHQPEVEKNAHDLRDKVTTTAQNVKEHVQAGVDHLRNKS